MYLYTVSPHDSKPMKGIKDTRATLSLNPEANAKFTHQSSYSKWHLTHLLKINLDEMSHLDTVKTREVANGFRWKTCSYGHLSVHGAHVQSHVSSEDVLSGRDSMIISTVFSMETEESVL